MNKFNWRRIVGFALVGVLFFVTACTSAPPSRFDQAQQESTNRGSSAVVKESQSGSSFNRYFPKSSSGYKVTFSQEKTGFSQAKLKKDGKDVAVLSISDTVNNPTARNKFQSSSNSIKGYPVVGQGKTGTAMLVGDRFQVKVSSRDGSFSENDRLSWLKKFDLSGLSRLK